MGQSRNCSSGRRRPNSLGSRCHGLAQLRQLSAVGIGLEAFGVETARSYITVDKYLRTNVPDLYAAGDVTGQVMLVSGATHEGHVAAVNAVTDADTTAISI
jgi:pyruvate/2-oxoglutarate dehydrogenase complex dihydrolipoamide dehydrogenase (E3) component